MKFLRIITKVCVALIILILILLLATLTTVDETPYTQTEAYQQTQQNLAQADKQLASQQTDSTTKFLSVGWAKANITPDHATPLAGYGNRRGLVSTSIRDSLWVRAFVIDNGKTRVGLVACDLLIVPPAVITAVQKNWPSQLNFPAQHIYYGAIHSHNSEGGWQTGIGSELITGAYDSTMVQFLAKQIIQACLLATERMATAEVGYGQLNAKEYVLNRLVGDDGPVDPYLRVLKFKKQRTGETAALVTYAAHATLMNEDNLAISRDYPGILVDSLEKNTVNFAAFMAGAVGSMKPLAKGANDEEELKNEAEGLQGDAKKLLPTIETKPARELAFVTVPVGLRQPQLQIAKGWKVRQWVWDKLFGLAQADIKALRIGNTVLLGMPADFSGELIPDLAPTAAKQKVNLMITSFNGNYIGYVTPDKYWSRDTYETVAMNWFGPYTGSYLVETGRKLLEKL
ncbi:MAG: neutral/alkaline non-lysosomal ceramidase N-terminal domain-containing protein [Siphonobacter sp.]